MEPEALDIDGLRVVSMVDESGRTWWGVADFLGALLAKGGRRTSRGVVELHRYMKREGSEQRSVLIRHSEPRRMPGTRGPLTPAMRAYGLLRLMRSMRFRRGDAGVAGRVREAQERLMALDRE